MRRSPHARVTDLCYAETLSIESWCWQFCSKTGEVSTLQVQFRQRELNFDRMLTTIDDWRLVSDSTRRSLRSADVSTCVVPPTLSSYGDRTFADWRPMSLHSDTHATIQLLDWYDTIRDAILTCARKPTRVSLIYRTETTTKKCKNRKSKK